MRATLVPFAADHLEPAAALLAARHRRDRVGVPDLPPTYEDVDATSPILRELVASDGMRGVVALRDGLVTGYLLGASLLRPPTHVGAGFRHPRSAQIPYDVVQSLLTELFHSFAVPPLFVPCLPETDAARRQDVADYLADPGCPHWLAMADGRAVGLLILEEPTSPQWHQPPLQSPPRAVYIDWAWTAPDMRSRGVGAALCAHANGTKGSNHG